MLFNRCRKKNCKFKTLRFFFKVSSHEKIYKCKIDASFLFLTTINTIICMGIFFICFVFKNYPNI